MRDKSISSLKKIFQSATNPTNDNEYNILHLLNTELNFLMNGQHNHDPYLNLLDLHECLCKAQRSTPIHDRGLWALYSQEIIAIRQIAEERILQIADDASKLRPVISDYLSQAKEKAQTINDIDTCIDGVVIVMRTLVIAAAAAQAFV